MMPRVVDIAQDGRYLAVHRGFLVVQFHGEEITRIPLDDLTSIVVHAHGTTYSNNLLVQLAERGISLVLCGANYCPVAWLWPIEGHHVQGARMEAQWAASKPLCKRIWQTLVKAKIEQQESTLVAAGKPDLGLKGLVTLVRSGDPDNIEAQAARRYWTALFGSDFRRRQDGDGINAMLNYGYAILRSAVARGVVAAGLHPTVGVHHRNRSNAMALVDDVMEPFRPLIDWAVLRLSKDGVNEVNGESKKALVAVLSYDLQTIRGTTPVVTCIYDLAISIAQSFVDGEARLFLPLPGLPIERLAQG
ncbi:MAG: type II CRISPR-associated endonuclease Cas1 [Myxococcales bacterium]|nr:type II CRISPR-associated endonuclease Cas1 [Myxococcales bacterium]